MMIIPSENDSPFPIFSKDVGLRDPHVVEVNHAGARRPDAQFVLRLGHGQAGSLSLYDEAGDAFVTLDMVRGRVTSKNKYDNINYRFEKEVRHYTIQIAELRPELPRRPSHIH